MREEEKDQGIKIESWVDKTKAHTRESDEYENDRISALIQNAFYFQIGRNCDQLLVFSAEMEKQQEMQNQDENGAK